MIWQMETREEFYQIPPKKGKGSTVSVHPEDNSGTDCKRGAPSVRGRGPFAQLSRRSSCSFSEPRAVTLLSDRQASSGLLKGARILRVFFCFNEL